MLIPDHETRRDVQTLLTMFEEMTEEDRRALLEIAKTLRRVQPDSTPDDRPKGGSH